MPCASSTNTNLLLNVFYVHLYTKYWDISILGAFRFQNVKGEWKMFPMIVASVSL